MIADQKSEWVTLPVAARFILGLSRQRVQQMVVAGVFKSACKPGTGRWKLKRSEVEAHLNRKIDPDG